ncbi:TIR domain-containing protein [Flavobacterium sp. LB3P122]|uniref:TIR domain-containing protein n=1 Tax=Flavobacterium algoriphilum TaxID=3398738 RepID=UPI003A8C12AF
MGRKIFVSYKYADELVKDLKKKRLVLKEGKFGYISRNTKARDYVDLLQDKIGKDHINLGEKDGESLGNFSDEAIETSLKNKIRQSSVTIVLVSKGMKTSDNEKDQWVPWEVSYSLRTVPTGGYTKQMNAILGVILPDETGTYDWYYKHNTECNCVTNFTGKLFKLLKDNTFNIKEKKFRECDETKIHITDEPSFFKTIKWSNFMFGTNYNNYIDIAINIKNNKEQYDVHINLD